MNEDKIKRTIDFLQDFGCAKLEHLQILNNDRFNNYNDILKSNCISKKDNVFYFNNESIDIKMLVALDILCKFKNRLKQYNRGYDPVYIKFLTKDNTTYNIIVSDKNSEKGILKRLAQAPFPYFDADKLILLFEDSECYEQIICNKPFIYCVYPEMEIIEYT